MVPLLLGLTKIFIILLIAARSVCAYSATLYLAGGCFWCTEKSFQEFPGVIDATSGYCNGSQKTANYRDVSTGKTNHRECIKIEYDKKATNLNKLVINYIKSINPMDLDGQFNDRGKQYQIEIYYQAKKDKDLFNKLIKKINSQKIYPQIIDIPIKPFLRFFPAEEYHQDYYIKNPSHYKKYEKYSGRKKFLQQYSERFNK